MAQSSTDPDDHEKASPGFFMKSTIKSINLKFPSVRDISTGELWAMLKSPESQSIVLLDARAEEEFNISHLEGALRIDWETKDVGAVAVVVEEQLKGKSNPTIVCYCSLGYRSAAVAKKLQQYYAQSGKPSPNIYNLTGSIFQWANEERTMVNQDGEMTHFVHPYTLFWGKLLHPQHRIKL